MSKLLTARELAEELGVTAETVLRWTRAGELPAVRLPGTARGRLRYRRADVDVWLEQHATAGDGTEEVSPTPDAARRSGVSSVLSPTPLRTAARTEEN